MFKAIATTVPNNPLTVAGDINGDGKADFLQTGSDGTTVTVLLGNGDGTSTTGATLSPTGGVSLTALGDVNGDGKLDLAIANAAGTGVTVMLGNGDGTFQAQGHAFATGVTALALGDVNGDGRADLVTSKGGDAVAVRLELGNGTFGSAISSVPYAHNDGKANYLLAVGDLTGDGRADLYVYDKSLGGSFILGGSGDGFFQTLPPFRSLSTATPYTAPSIGDINGDGRADVLLSSLNSLNRGSYPPNSNGTSILLGSGSEAGPVSGYVSDLHRSGTLIVTFATLADVNGDGRLDILYGESSGTTMSALISSPSANTAATGVLSVSASAELSFAVSDPDGNLAATSVVQRSNGSGGYDNLPSNYQYSYQPNAADNGHTFRFITSIADSNLNVTTVTSREVHVAGSFARQGAPVALAATALDDLLVGTYDTAGASNIVVYADTVRHETTLTRTLADKYNTPPAGVVDGNFSAFGPGGTDALFNIQQFRFLDGVLTVNANDPASIVTRLYEGAFGRDPDSTGLSHSTAALEHGDGIGSVAAALTASPEFQSHGGALTSSSFVSSLYETILHRTADAEEAQYWAHRIDAGTSRADVLVAIAQSSEAINVSSATLKTTSIFALDEHAAQVARLYDTAFGRDPDRGGLEVWRGFLDHGGAGHSLGDVANAFAGSPEFTARYGQATTDAYVTALYQNTLHRAPDDAGRAHWNAVLNSAAETRAQVALDFSESAEHQSLLAPHIQDGIHLI